MPHRYDRIYIVPGLFAIVVGTMMLSACLGSGPSGAKLAISVAPLQLPDIVDACYSLTVTNAPGGTGDTVWTKSDICSSGYGDNKGAISYVGPCDASVSPIKNSVILELTSLDDATGPAEFVNPCGAPDNAPCRIETTCAENTDTPVVFDLTIMRPAHQGFFDVAVDFEDVFCSGKIDCDAGDCWRMPTATATRPWSSVWPVPGAPARRPRRCST